MARGFYDQLVKILKAHGFAYRENAKGGHEKWVHEESGQIQIVPRPCMSRHTANGICKDIGAGKRF